MKLDINQKNTETHAKTRKLNNMLLNNEWVNTEIKEEIKRYLETRKMRTQQSKICGTLGKAVLRGKYIALQVHLKKNKKMFNKEFKFTLKET